MNAPACFVNIAGLGVQIESDFPALTGALARRYADFSARIAPLCEVYFSWQPAPTRTVQPVIPPPVTWSDSGARFTAPEYRGWIDLDNGQAQLHLATDSPLEGAEYFLRVVYALLALRAGGILFHAAAIVRNMTTFVFFGPSGAGKSTVAAFSSGAQVLNDDLVVFRPDGGVWWAYGTPFWNPTQVRPSPGSAPLGVFLRLHQAQEVAVTNLDGASALAEFLACVPVLPTNPAFVPRLVELGATLFSHIPAYRLFFRKDASFWPLVESLI
ncbi:MAG: hypothetical protein Fur0018_17860 [Anaerolineales bacterium]